MTCEAFNLTTDMIDKQFLHTRVAAYWSSTAVFTEVMIENPVIVILAYTLIFERRVEKRILVWLWLLTMIII